MASPTLRQVAEMAGVSIGTASQALNNRASVAPATRARVIDAAQALGYPIKLNGGNGTEIKVLGLLMKHDYGEPVEINPFYSHVQAGIESECRRRSISLMYANIEVDLSNHPLVWPAMINEQRVDGLILAGTFIEDAVDTLRRRLDIPIVLVDSYAPNLSFDSVLIDNVPGATTAVKYLLAQGHTRIGLIGSNEHSSPGVMDRRKAYFATLQAHGIGTFFVEDSTLSEASGRQATHALLSRAPEVTALFCCNDASAVGAIRAAQALGRHVPEDLSVIGFDNVDLASVITPSLTTIHVHKAWMGMLGVRQLLERAQSPDQPKISLVLTTELIERNSVCRLGERR